MFKRTHNCCELTEKDIGKQVCLSGWVNTWRDHGGVVFIDLRDREGITQIVFKPDKQKGLHSESRKLRAESVISIKGLVEARPQGTVNEKLRTGKIEVTVEELAILNVSATPPF
jgi:aspartyl-tRNA synthetase